MGIGILPSFFRGRAPRLRQLEGVPVPFSTSTADSSWSCILAFVLLKFAMFGHPPLPPPKKTKVRSFLCLLLRLVFRFCLSSFVRALTGVRR